MVCPIMKDPIFLARRAQPVEAAEAEELSQNLKDTLLAHREECVGMAANMIGVCRRAIVFDDGGKPAVMLNPEILRREGPYDAQEGCLSLPGQRPAKRWKKIKVRWQNEQMQFRVKTLEGWTAQIIQHEIDHCDGILI